MNMNKSGPYRAAAAEPIRQASSPSLTTRGTLSGTRRHAVLLTRHWWTSSLSRDSWLREQIEGELRWGRQVPSSSAEGSSGLGAPWPQTWALPLSEHVALGDMHGAPTGTGPDTMLQALWGSLSFVPAWLGHLSNLYSSPFSTKRKQASGWGHSTTNSIWLVEPCLASDDGFPWTVSCFWVF